MVSAPTASEPPNYVLKKKGGKNIIQRAPKFSPDESLLFVISDQNVQIYNVSTAEYVKSLRGDDQSLPIVGMDFPPDDDRTLITCDKAGNITTWKWHAAVQSSSKKLQIPENSNILYFHVINNDEAVVSWNEKKLTKLGIYNINTGEIVRLIPVPKLKTNRDMCIAIEKYNDHTLIALSNGNQEFYIFDTVDTTKHLSYNNSSNLKVTSLAWNPSFESLAVGDALGRVIIWRNFFTSSNPAKETLHWHQLPLTSVTFSPRGGLLLTGGLERVMVAWGNNSSKRFLPRLPGPIHHITASTAHIAVATADNGIQIVDAGTLYVTVCIREAGGLGGVRHPGVSRGPSLQYARSAPGLLLPASSGHLHLYSTTTNSLYYTMDITNTNIVHPERNNLCPEQIEINEISVGCRSQWLVTWEGKNEQERIRWWEWSGHDWRLHTVAACPHQPHKFSGLHLATDTPVTFTMDQSCNMRFWRILYTVPGYEDKSAWYTNSKCSGSGGEVGGIALSSDGSVAAAWFGARLTFWDTQDGIQKTSLAHPALRPQGRLVQFGRDHHMHYIACTTDTCLAVWNTMTLRLLWIVRLDTSALISDPFSDNVAAITKNNDVFIFKMSDSEPLWSKKEILPVKQGTITSAAFAPGESGTTDFRLYFLREQHEIFLIENSDSALEIDLPSYEMISDTAAKMVPSAFSARVAEKQINSVSRYQSNYSAQPSTKAILNELLLSSAAHAQPKLSSLCCTVLRALAATVASSDNKDDAVEIIDEVNFSAETENPEKVIKVPSRKKLMKESMEWISDLISEDL